MRAIIVLSLVSFTFGCAHKTVHEECSTPEIVKRYRDYDQCYQEISGARAAYQNYVQQQPLEDPRKILRHGPPPGQRKQTCTGRMVGNSYVSNCTSNDE